MANYNLGEARGKIVLETDFGGLKEGQAALDNAKRSAEGAAQSQSQAWGKVGTTATVAGATIVAAFAVGVGAAANFEYQLSAIQAVSGATADEMDLISEAALRIGKDTSFSASEAATAMEELVKAGISVDDTLHGAADAVVALAAAGGVDLPTAATIASNAMNQFGLKAEDLVGVVDKIAGAANASAIDVNEFGMSMGQVGAVANLAGLSFDDTTLAIAAMGNAGIKGSDAGTSLKTMLMNLQPATEQAAGLMKELGIITEDGTNKFYDAEGSLRSMAEISDVLSTALTGMTDAQKQATLTTLFGSDAVRGAAIVAETGAAGFDKLNAAIDKTSAADVAATRMDNLKGTTDALMGSIETMWITIGTRLIPAMTDMVKKVTDAVNWFMTLDSETQNLYAGIVLLAGGLLLAFGATIKILHGIAQARAAILAITGANALWTAATAASGAAQGATLAQMVAAKAVMIAQKVATIAMATAQGVATAAQWAFNAALTANPIGLIIAAVVALVAALIWFFTQTELGQDIVSNVLKFIQEAWANLSSFLATVWEGIVAVASTVWTGVMDVVNAVVTWFQTYVLPIIQFVIDMIIAYFTMYYTVVSTIWNAVMAAIGAVVAWFQTYVWPVIAAVINLIVALFNFFWGVVQIVWQSIMDFISGIVNGIVAFVTAAFQVWLAMVTTTMNNIRDFITTVWNAISSFLRPFIDAIVKFVTDTWKTMQLGISVIMAAIRSAIETAWNAIQNFIRPIVSGVVSFITSTWGAITGFVSTTFNNVKNAIQGPLEDALAFISGIQGKIIGFFAGAGNWLFNAGKDIINGLLKGLQSMLGGLKDLLNGITASIPQLKGPPEKDKVLLQENGRLIMQSLANGLAAEMGSVYGLLDGMNTGIPSHLRQDLDTSWNAISRGDKPAGIVLNLEYHAAEGDGTKTKEDLMNMLGNAASLVREKLE
jgi:TP901 family phage tail tape measure protein